MELELFADPWGAAMLGCTGLSALLLLWAVSQALGGRSTRVPLLLAAVAILGFLGSAVAGVVVGPSPAHATNAMPSTNEAGSKSDGPDDDAEPDARDEAEAAGDEREPAAGGDAPSGETDGEAAGNDEPTAQTDAADSPDSPSSVDAEQAPSPTDDP